ncbi:MAG TPA: GNAT family N-acetyltransferase [Bacteroidia bacterium]|jgi:ribosomal protein S18 acetylase RimI-like enzyme|nr:GNAT family N-acetyltransferase [Bacteroidia bacterium]
MLVEVKEAVLADAEVISKLSAETFFETYAWYNTPENMREYTRIHFSVEQTKKDFATPNTHFFTAEFKDEVIGYAKLRVFEDLPELKNKKHIEIERIYVQKKHHDKKVGYALIKKCIDFARAKNYEVIWLGVWEQNLRALNFYLRVGFEKFSTHIFQLGNDAQKDHLLKLDLIK